MAFTYKLNPPSAFVYFRCMSWSWSCYFGLGLGLGLEFGLVYITGIETPKCIIGTSLGQPVESLRVNLAGRLT